MFLLSSHHQHRHARRLGLPYRRLHDRVEAITLGLDHVNLGFAYLAVSGFLSVFHFRVNDGIAQSEWLGDDNDLS